MGKAHEKDSRDEKVMPAAKPDGQDSSDPQVTLNKLSAATKKFDEQETKDDISAEIDEYTKKMKEHDQALEAQNSYCDCMLGKWLKETPDKTAAEIRTRAAELTSDCKQCGMTGKTLFRKELDARFAAEQLAIKNQKDQFETMATARQSALDQRQKQFIDKLKKDQKRDADADKRHLAILERIKGRREGHIKLNATTKGAMELTHAAMEKTIKATSAKSDKILAEATEKAKEAVAGVKADFDAKHVSLKSEHDALDQKVKVAKEETDKNLAEAKIEAKDETTAAKKELETTLEKQGTKFTEQLSNHDTNHEITEKYILYHDDAENWEGLSKKQKERYGKLKWQDRPIEASSAPTAEFKGVQVQKPYKGKDNAKNAKAQTRRRLAPMTPSEHVLTRRRLVDRPKSHCTVLETLLEEINRLN